MYAPEPVLVDWEFVKRALDMGVKLCQDESPRKEPRYPNPGEKKEMWFICLLGLPQEEGIRLGERTSVLAINPIIKLPGQYVPLHNRYTFPSSPEADEFGLKLADRFTEKDPKFLHSKTDKAFIRLDIAKFSEFPEHLQPLVLGEIQQIVDQVLYGYVNALPFERAIHTGDGFILAYAYPLKPNLIHTATEIAKRLDERNDAAGIKIHFRMSITGGPVYLTRELAPDVTNYIGEPIIDSERLISCMPSTLDDLIYISDTIYRKLREELKGRVARLGSHPDKHGKHHRVYSLDYTG